jgi:hypothetical protein
LKLRVSATNFLSRFPEEPEQLGLGIARRKDIAYRILAC